MSGIAVLGAGAFGTALSIALSRAGIAVSLWSHDAGHAEEMARQGMNARRLPGRPIPETVAFVSDIASVDEEVLLLAVPAQSLGSFLERNAPALDGRTLVSCAKGIDLDTGLRPSELLSRACPGSRVAVLTGPSFAADIAEGLPTALTLAVRGEGEDLQAMLSTRTLRLYLSDDLTGAELGGALKNVIALAAGITIGAGLGESARAAVVTRGFAEITRFAVSEGARPETLTGLSGLGDLLLTSTSEKSRNYAAGLAIGAGQGVREGVTIEGLATAEAIAAIARDRGIDMPLSATVAAVTHGRMSVKDAEDRLMSRPLTTERRND